jgi:DNA polymerase-3 subunit beta
MSNEIGFTAKRNVLMQALGNIQAVIANKNAIAILNNVRLDVAGNKLTITGTDLDISIAESIDIDSDIEGSLTISARGLYDIVKKMPVDSDVNIRGNSDGTGKVQIKSKGCRFTLPCLPSDDFPSIDRGDLTNSFEMPVNDFLKLINKPRFAMSTNEAQYNLHGINIKSVDSNIIATATNAHKLAKITLPMNENADIASFSLPPKTIGLLSKVLINPAEFIKLSLSESKICAIYGNVVIVSKLIDGAFPDVERIFPSVLENTLKINRELLLAAIDRISLAADFKSRQITLSVSPGIITITANSSENGLGEEDIEVETELSGVKKNYNSKYLLEILSNIESETIIINFNNDHAPTLITGEGVDNEVYLVMSMMDANRG